LSEPPIECEQASRWIAVELNNKTWDRLELNDLGAVLVQGAHGSVYQWHGSGEWHGVE
jgi:hypothetical protein